MHITVNIESNYAPCNPEIEKSAKSAKKSSCELATVPFIASCDFVFVFHVMI